MARNYKKLEIYNLSYSLVLDVYKLIDKFPDYEIKNISLQLRRAAVSIPLNIAEGTSRKSKKEFLNFLSYAYGSAKEVEVLLNLSNDLDFIKNKKFNSVNNQLNNLMAKLFLFMRDLESKISNPKYKFFQKLDKDKLVLDTTKRTSNNKNI